MLDFSCFILADLLTSSLAFRFPQGSHEIRIKKSVFQFICIPVYIPVYIHIVIFQCNKMELIVIPVTECVNLGLCSSLV